MSFFLLSGYALLIDAEFCFTATSLVQVLVADVAAEIMF